MKLYIQFYLSQIQLWQQRKKNLQDNSCDSVQKLKEIIKMPHLNLNQNKQARTKLNYIPKPFNK